MVMSLIEAESLLQKAYDISTGQSDSQLRLPEELFETGIMDVHYAWYNSGLSAHPEICQELKEHSDGALAQLIRTLRDMRLDHYTRETLNKMYGLSD